MSQLDRQLCVDVPESVPASLSLGRLKNVDQAMRTFDPKLVEQMADHCLRADEFGYAAFKSFRDNEQNSGWRMFEHALEHGIDSVDDPAPAIVELFQELDRVPHWVDYDQLRRGAVAFWRAGPLVPMVLAYSVIAVGFTGYAASRPVMFSNRMTDREQIGQRLLESFRFIAKAYAPGGMERHHDGFKHTARVRMIHSTVRHVLSQSNEWDWANWGIPINNFDAMDTQAGQFGVEVVDSLELSGVKLSSQERADIFALTRYVGYVIGIPEAILHTNEDDARNKHALHALLETQADHNCQRIVRGIVDFSCEESLGGYDVLPGLLGKIMTVQRRKKLSYGLMTAWQPPSIVEQLGVKADHWRFVLPALRPFVATHDRFTRRFSPGKDPARAQRVLDEFEIAIAMRDGETHALAEPEQLATDVRHGARKVPAMVAGTG